MDKALSIQIRPYGPKESCKTKKDASVYYWIDASSGVVTLHKLDLSSYKSTAPFDLPFANVASLVRYCANYLKAQRLSEEEVDKIKKILSKILNVKELGIPIDSILASVVPLTEVWDNIEGHSHELVRRLEEEDNKFASWTLKNIKYVTAGPSHAYKPPVDSKQVGVAPDTIQVIPADASAEPTAASYDRDDFITAIRDIVGKNFVSVAINNDNQLFYQANKSACGVEPETPVRINKRAQELLGEGVKPYGNVAMISRKRKALKVAKPVAKKTPVKKAEEEAQVKKQAVKRKPNLAKQVANIRKTVLKNPPPVTAMELEATSSVPIGKTAIFDFDDGEYEDED